MSLNIFFNSTSQIENRLGFCDLELFNLTKTISPLVKLVIKAAKQGFRYCGDTQSSSKANTDPKKKWIFINRELDLKTAILSLSYELINALNASKFQSIYNKFLSDKTPTRKKAKKYAKAILKVEANAVYNKYLIAKLLNLLNKFRNKNLTRVIKENEHDPDLLNKIWIEMQSSGKVHNGTKNAMEHYQQQYFEYCKK